MGTRCKGGGNVTTETIKVLGGKCAEKKDHELRVNENIFLFLRFEQWRNPDLQRLSLGKGQNLLHERLEDWQPKVSGEYYMCIHTVHDMASVVLVNQLRVLRYCVVCTRTKGEVRSLIFPLRSSILTCVPYIDNWSPFQRDLGVSGAHRRYWQRRTDIQGGMGKNRNQNNI